jgi:hypothetical protein
MDNKILFRGVIIGLLLMMVVRSLVWLIHPDADASGGQYGLNVLNIIACGLTAYATWRPSEGAQRVLRGLSRRG